MSTDHYTTRPTFQSRRFPYHSGIAHQLADYLNDAHDDGYYAVSVTQSSDDAFVVIVRLTRAALKAREVSE